MQGNTEYQYSISLPTQFAGTHLYAWVERGTVRMKCLDHEQQLANAEPRELDPKFNVNADNGRQTI